MLAKSSTWLFWGCEDCGHQPASLQHRPSYTTRSNGIARALPVHRRGTSLLPLPKRRARPSVRCAVPSHPLSFSWPCPTMPCSTSHASRAAGATRPGMAWCSLAGSVHRVSTHHPSFDASELSLWNNSKAISAVQRVSVEHGCVCWPAILLASSTSVTNSSCCSGGRCISFPVGSVSRRIACALLGRWTHIWAKICCF